MYLDKPSLYSNIKGMMTKPNLTKADFVRLVGFDQPISYSLIQSSTKLLNRYNSSTFSHGNTTLNILNEKDAVLTISIGAYKRYKIEFIYSVDTFPSLRIEKTAISGCTITSNAVLKRLDPIDREIEFSDYMNIIGELQNFIPTLLYYIYVQNYGHFEDESNDYAG